METQLLRNIFNLLDRKHRKDSEFQRQVLEELRKISRNIERIAPADATYGGGEDAYAPDNPNRLDC